ncbi:hypothetical protein KAX02_13550 [candidate division WOR-3 bacterium]|nr:hypothetical protein [candidate division WOR-3 bacterium]
MIVGLTEKDNKAEMALIVVLHGKSRGEQREICVDFGVPWEEYLRLLRKWSRVIARWEKEGGNKNEQQQAETTSDI